MSGLLSRRMYNSLENAAKSGELDPGMNPDRGELIFVGVIAPQELSTQCRVFPASDVCCLTPYFVDDIVTSETYSLQERRGGDVGKG